LLGDEKNASRNREIYLRHLEDGITIAESDFPADQRASLMMDWIERSFSARNLGWDPLSLLIRAHLKHFQWIVARSHPDRLEGYREISERLREMRTLLLENGGER